MNDEDIMNIVNNVFKKMDVANIIEEMGGESDEDGPLSDDSDCISDCNDDFTEIDEKNYRQFANQCIKWKYKTMHEILLLFYG